MPPSVAALACIVFIGLAIGNELRFGTKVSNAIWVPFIWLIISGSRSLTQWFGLRVSEGAEYTESALAGSPIDRTFLTVVIFISLCILWKRKARALELLSSSKWILFFLFYLGVSVLWSDVVDVSLRRWFRLAGAAVAAVAILTEREPLEALKISLRSCAYLLIPLSVLYVKYFPQYGVLYDWEGSRFWAGVALEKNTLGHLCLVSILFIFGDMIADWSKIRSGRVKGRLIIDMIILVMALWLLKGAQNAFSASSVGALIVGVGLYLLLKLNSVKLRIGNIDGLTILGCFILMVIILVIQPLELLVTALDRDLTFTGRVPLWETLIELGLRKPLLGYGYGGFWTAERIEFIYNRVNLVFRVGHNGFLEIFVEGGFVGLLLLVGVIISTLVKIVKMLRFNLRHADLILSLFIVVIICNLTETSFARPQGFLWFIFLLIAIIDLRPAEMDKTERKLPVN